jgi:AcrR family transcriptional regulator
MPTAIRRASASPSPRTARLARKRAHILDAASRVFGARVYHLVSMDEIAHVAGVGKGTLYRYFPSKEDLYLAIVDEAFGLLIRRLDGEQAREAPPVVALRRMIEAIVETFARHLPVFRLMHRGEARLLQRKKQVIRVRREHIARLLGDVLDRGARTGTFRKVDPVLGPSMLIGMVWGTTLNHAPDTPPGALADRVSDFCLLGLLAGRGESAS